jgi:hypothetical protein
MCTSQGCSEDLETSVCFTSIIWAFSQASAPMLDRALLPLSRLLQRPRDLRLLHIHSLDLLSSFCSYAGQLLSSPRSHGLRRHSSSQQSLCYGIYRTQLIQD